MIKFLTDKTVAGDRYGMGAIAEFEARIERDLIVEGAAIVCPIPTLIAQYYAGWSRSSVNGAGDQSYQTLASVTVPGSMMGLNSRVLITADWSFTLSTSNKYMTVFFGGTAVSVIIINNASYPSTKIMTDVMNINSLSSQKSHNTHTYGVASTAHLTSAVDTSENSVLDFSCKWGASQASESIALVGYSIWHYPGN